MKAIELLKEIKAVVSWWKGKESRSSQVQYLVCQVEAELEKTAERIKELEVVSHNLAETMGIDYAIKKLSIMSDDYMALGAATILKGIQKQAKAALAKGEKE